MHDVFFFFFFLREKKIKIIIISYKEQQEMVSPGWTATSVLACHLCVAIAQGTVEALVCAVFE